MTHDIWLQKWEAGKFRRWREVGEARVTVDGTGNISVESYQDLTAIGGWSGYTQVLPKGIRPKDPEPQPKRPEQSGEQGDA